MLAIQRHRIAATTALVVCLGIVSLSVWQSLPKAELQPTALSDNTLRVATRISPHIYYEDELGPTGFEYLLLEEFAKRINKKLEIVTVDNLPALYRKLDKTEVHMASANLSADNDMSTLLFSQPYFHSGQQVVYRAGSKRPRKVTDLIGYDVLVTAESIHAKLLEQYQQELPELQWREATKIDYIDILGLIENGTIDYAIVDTNEFALHRSFFPKVKAAFKLTENEPIAWAFPKQFANSDLYRAANQYLQDIEADGSLAVLQDRFFGHVAHINQVKANEFSKNIRRRLPKYLPIFKSVAEEHELDWRLLAAIGYQESLWNEKAISPTGVKGLMMLTRTTAKELGIENRLDPEQSLRGGATYFNNIYKRLPSDILDPDRTWFALAAYNVGTGHLEDARIITEIQGGNPDSWYDVKQRLPLLTQKKWYSRTRHGYARGHEPVIYVRNIRHYYNVLSWHDSNIYEQTHKYRLARAEKSLALHQH